MDIWRIKQIHIVLLHFNALICLLFMLMCLRVTEYLSVCLSLSASVLVELDFQECISTYALTRFDYSWNTENSRQLGTV